MMDIFGFTKIQNVIDAPKNEQIEKKIDSFTETIINNKYVYTLFVIFIALYGHYAAPPLSDFLRKLFDLKIFKLFVLYLIGYLVSKNHAISIACAMIFNILIQLTDK